MTSDDAFMVLAGVRYCLGRHKYGPSTCCEWLKAKWPAFKDADRAQIAREIRFHIKESELHDMLWDVDLRTWQTFVAWVETTTHAEDTSHG